MTESAENDKDRAITEAIAMLKDAQRTNSWWSVDAALERLQSVSGADVGLQDGSAPK